jgi:predicted dehydrogenase
MVEMVRVGVIGTSSWSEDFHLATLKSHDSVVLAAICGRDGRRAQELADRHGVQQVSLITRRCLLAPEDLHHPMVMDAVSAGLHVLCEKPMAFSAAQSAEMLVAADKAGVKHMVQFTNRGLPHYRYVKRLIDEGYVGEPYSAYFYWPSGWDPAEESNPYSWPFDARRAKGAANELGAHIVDLARWFLGDVVRVSGSLRTFVNRTGPSGEPMENANDSAFLLLDFASGAHGVVHVGTPNIVGPGLHHTGQIIIIHGKDGTLETRGDPWTTPAVSEITALRRGSDHAQILSVPDAYYGGTDSGDTWAVFQQQSVGPRLFIDSIISGSSLSPSFYDGHQVQRVIEAAFQSHVTGQAQTLTAHLATL